MNRYTVSVMQVTHMTHRRTWAREARISLCLGSPKKFGFSFFGAGGGGGAAGAAAARATLDVDAIQLHSDRFEFGLGRHEDREQGKQSVHAGQSERPSRANCAARVRVWVFGRGGGEGGRKGRREGRREGEMQVGSVGPWDGERR